MYTISIDINCIRFPTIWMVIRYNFGCYNVSIFVNYCFFINAFDLLFFPKNISNAIYQIIQEQLFLRPLHRIPLVLKQCFLIVLLYFCELGYSFTIFIFSSPKAYFSFCLFCLIKFVFGYFNHNFIFYLVGLISICYS